MPRCLLSVFGPAERREFGGYPSKAAMLAAFADIGAFDEKLERDLDEARALAAAGSSARRGTVEARRFHTQESVEALRAS